VIKPGKPTDECLGCPAGNVDFRINHFAEMTGGKGFYQMPRVSDGKRAARKAEAREIMLKRSRDPQPSKYRNLNQKEDAA
jgi:hypothetical protein